jgi:uncharacterized delta-60 repeat protein
MDSGSFDFTILRYHSNGSLDNSFNGSGIVTTSISPGLDQATSVIIQPPDNKIVVAGQSDALGNPKFAIVRYLNDGKLDTTFNGTGIVTTSIGAISLGSSLISQANGKIVVAGSSSDGQGPRFTLARYNQDGKLDATFNQTGIVTTDIGTKPSEAFSIAIQPDGKLVVAGFTYDFDFVLARYLGDPINVFYLPTILKNR